MAIKEKFLVTLFVLGLSISSSAQQHVNALFIGNSYTSVNNLPQMVAQIAGSLSDTLTYQSNTPGACTFMQHCQNQSMTLVRQGGWDAVILQEQSQYPSFPDSQVAQEVMPYARQLVDSVYAASPCAEPMFYMTWGRKNGDASNAVYFPPLGTYAGMDSLLALRYRQMADENDASLCPVGRVWHWLRDHNPEIELYQSDESHPSPAGTYAAACSFYTLLFRRDPAAITYNASLDASVAATIRQAVRQVVYDSLSYWQRPRPELSVSRTDSENQMEEYFQVWATHADSLRVDWGDGTDTLFTPEHPNTLRHIYAASGSYPVTLVASRHCMETAQEWFFHTTGTEDIVAPEEYGQMFIATPNPARDRVELQFGEIPQQLELFDMQGHLLECHRPQRQHFTLYVGHLPAGTYLIRVAGATPSSSRLVVR